MDSASIAIIGGSGMYDMEGLVGVREVKPDTPFGQPSDSIVLGELDGVSVAFIPRHGRGHRLMPTEIPARANIYALKTLGVDRIISVSAVGSLREEIRPPSDLVVPDQLIDRTKGRASTFFGDGLVGHIAFAEPFCQDLSMTLVATARDVGATVHEGGVCVVVEGPAFSTRAESFMYRSWGASILGMTALPEAKLAREAEMCYATLACPTDYDCWYEGEESVSVELVVTNLLKNVARSKEIVRQIVPKLSQDRVCGCSYALKDAIITGRDAIPESTRTRLWPLLAKYLA